jgi:hypothetical protein
MDEKPTEQEFIDRYYGYVARRCARDLYRTIYPTGQTTNGPGRVIVEASHLTWLLESHKRPVRIPVTCPHANLWIGGDGPTKCADCGAIVE